MIEREASSNDNTCEFRGHLDEQHIHQKKKCLWISHSALRLWNTVLWKSLLNLNSWKHAVLSKLLHLFSNRLEHPGYVTFDVAIISLMFNENLVKTHYFIDCFLKKDKHRFYIPCSYSFTHTHTLRRWVYANF